MKNEENHNCINFSIDHILNRAGQNNCTVQCSQNLNTEENFNRNENIDFHRFKTEYEQSSFQNFTFQWLNCTRYHPPKIPRPFKKESVKRQPGRHPRIPFTAIQIEILEKSYKNSQYLCPNEITKLSQQLDLSDTRIKIWFQNRRAREKREKESNLTFKQKQNISSSENL